MQRALTVTVETKSAEALLTLRNGHRRMAYAIASALNKTILGSQGDVRRRVSGEFNLRQSSFVLRESAIIRAKDGTTGFATASGDESARNTKTRQLKLEARMQVGQKQRFLMERFEDGAQRNPFTIGADNVGVPLTGGAARRSFGKRVPLTWHFSNLALRESKITKTPLKRRIATSVPKKTRVRSLEIRRHVTSGGKVQYKGARRTFILLSTQKAPLGGLFQRVGRGRNDIRMVYTFARPMKLDQRLRFSQTARQFVTERFERWLAWEVANTINLKRERDQRRNK